MRYRRISGKDVSVIALGSSDFGGKTSEAEAIELMDAYRSIGGSFIDTARIYGSFSPAGGGESERVIGNWMESRRCRNEIFLSTKGGHPPIGHMDVGRLSRDDILSDLSASLEALKTDHVDFYWLHRDDITRPVGEIMETLESLRETGLASMVGVSNWRPNRINALNEYARLHGFAPIDGNQLQFSLARQMVVEDPTLVMMDEESYRMHLKENMLCACFSSIAKGFFAKLETLGADGLTDKARRRFYYPENLIIFDELKRLKAETGMSIHALSLAYLTCQPFPTFPLCGASSISQVEALGEAGDAILTREQCEALRSFTGCQN